MNILRHFVAVDYHHPFEPLPGVRATFLDAGHILGSAVTLLDITENGRRHRLAFSGDLGHSNQPILRAPEIPEGIDTLIMESTYGRQPDFPRPC
jgi:metallo-beta-lactamase family protein